MIGFILGAIGALVALIGWFGFKSVICLIVGTSLYIIETLVEWKELNAGAKIVDIIIVAIGCIIAIIIKTPFYIGGMIAINCYSAIMSLLSAPMYLQQIKWYFK